jgi:hypothetical protein
MGVGAAIGGLLVPVAIMLLLFRRQRAARKRQQVVQEYTGHPAWEKGELDVFWKSSEDSTGAKGTLQNRNLSRKRWSNWNDI